MTDIYLDNNATTRVDPAVVEAMLPFFTEHYGNPSSRHRFGDRVRPAVQQARRQVQALLGAGHETEIIFTSGGTEANVTALLCACRARPERREVITTAVEHPAVLDTCQALEQAGYTVHYLGVDSHGRLDLDAYRRLLSERTALVSVMWANNETGTLFPVAALAERARAAGVLFHTDAVQAVGKVPVALEESGIDMLSLAGHKLHAPKGIGVLYVRQGVPFQPLLRGGGQERGRRAGTENTAAIVALGKAAELAMTHLNTENTAVRALRDRLQAGILAGVPQVYVTGDPANRLPNTVNMAFKQVEGEGITLLLDKAGIAVSNGSACAAGAMKPSHVMQAMGVPASDGTVRFSLSRYTTLEEVERVIQAVPPIIDRLRALSPHRQAHHPRPDAGKPYPNGGASLPERP